MEKRLSRIILITAGVVIGLSVFVILAMLFYSPADYLQRYDQLAREQGLRFSVASAFFRSVGVSAYVGWLIILAWAVVVFFRESLGKVAVRAGSLAVVIVSGAALADLLGSGHLGGDVGRALGSVIQASLGTGVGVVLMGSIFGVSLVLATDRGFIPIYRAARDALAVAEISPPEPSEAREPGEYEDVDLASRIDETARAVEEGDAETEVREESSGEREDAGTAPEAEAAPEAEPPAGEAGGEPRRPGIHIPLGSLLRTPIAEEELDEDLLTDEEETGGEADREASPGAETRPEAAAREETESPDDGAPGTPIPTVPAPAEEPPLVQAFPPSPEAEAPPSPGDDALAAVFDALIGPAPEPPAPPPAPAREFTLIDDEIILDGEEEIPDRAPAPEEDEPPASRAGEEEPSAREAAAEPAADAVPAVILIDEEISLFDEPAEAPAVEAAPGEEAEENPAEEEAPGSGEETAGAGEEEEEDRLLPFMEPEPEPEPEAEEPGEDEPEAIPVLEDISPREKPGVLRALFGRRAPRGGGTPARDPLLAEAADLVIERGRASVVLLQRRLDIGYTRASRLVDALEREGLVGPLLPSGSREVLLTAAEWKKRREAP